ncbi:MAG: Cof-type HAD-IIB family hydrolase [Muribaculaceae bacterium]|nr:Cof-type HAD-IIB family hydrolase [Muribaculaceae bacterium]
MTRTLYVTDLDGTLLNNNSVVGDKSAQILRDLTDDGALITVATARTPATVVGLLANTRISLPAVVMTGATLYDIPSRRYIDPKFIDASTVEEAYTYLTERGINPFVYTLHADQRLHAYHHREMTKLEHEFYDQRRDLSLKQFHFGEPIDDESLIHTLLLFAVGQTDQLNKAAEEVSARTGQAVTCYNDIFHPGNSFMELFAPGVSKAAAVRRLAEERGAGRIVAFGDNLNDIPMFREADVAVAVENAFDEAKEAADVVIGRNSADAVARYIAEDFYR